MTSIKDDLCTAWRREWLLVKRQSSHIVNGLCFYVLVGLVYQILLGPNMAMPPVAALAILWVLSLLAILLIAQGWVVADLSNGFYELWLSQGRSLWLLFFAKLCAQWIVIGSFYALFAPIVAYQLGLTVTPLLIFALLLSSIAMVFCCGFGAAVTAGQAAGGLLAAVIVLPLNLPPMIFGAGMVLEALQGFDPMPVMLLTLALSLSFFLFVPPLMSLCIRITIE